MRFANYPGHPMLHPALERERRAVAAYLGGCAQRLRELLPLVVADANIEALHDLRVHLRRVRSAFRALHDALPVADAAGLAAECQWLAGRGSGLRDIDVFLHRLDDYLDGKAPEPAPLARLRTALGRRRAHERRALLSSLHTRRAQRLFARLEVLVHPAVDAPGWTDEPIAGSTLWAAYRRVRGPGRRITPESPPEDLHELRKRCKRLRYLLEMYCAAYDSDELPDLLRRLRKLQNVLGDYQDFHTHAALLRELRAEWAGSTPDDAASLALLDRLLAVLADRADEARARFASRFAQFDRPRHHRRRRRLFAPDPLLAPPMIGSAGYCHGWATGERIALPVGKVVCVGRNYAAHAAELGNPVPEIPLLFIKPPSAVVDLAPAFRIPAGRGSVHHELEIAVLIGRRLRDAQPAEARAAIAGLGLGIDLTLRDEQDVLKSKAHPWEIAKGFDGSCPLTPFVPVDEDLDLGRLGTSLSVDGVLRQCGSSAQMLTPIIELLCYASSRFSLWPGDVVLTGTPAGVAALQPGDRVVAELDGLITVHAEVV
ncbi:MAG: hypothetical protein CALGDGBN_03326 [Pseudomonadales bacterium]|nr:hypothetical protein [Pseudomonadales bacterium]